jgi:hypothetical protein
MLHRTRVAFHSLNRTSLETDKLWVGICVVEDLHDHLELELELELPRRQAYFSSWSDEKNLAECSADVLKVCWSTVSRLFTASRYGKWISVLSTGLPIPERVAFKEYVCFFCDREVLTWVRDLFGTMMRLQHCYGASPGFCVGLQAVNQQVISLYCTLHRENCVFGELSEGVGVVRKEATKVLNFRKVISLNRNTFRRQCWGTHLVILIHVTVTKTTPFHEVAVLSSELSQHITCCLYATPIAGGY